MTSPKGSPVAASERTLSLDALRGIALFGVLTVNVLTAFRISLFEQFLPRLLPGPLPGPPGGAGSAADQAIASIVRVGLESKAFILFSLLFGVGLAAQHARITGRGGTFTIHVARRLAMLLAIGVAHLFLVWNGDILTLYAVVGVVAAPLLGLSTRTLLGAALALFVVHVLPLPYPRSFESTEAMAAHVEAAHHIYGAGSFTQVLAFRIHEVRPISALLIWSAPRALGLFLLGACAWRWGLFLPRRLPRPLRARLIAFAAVGLGGGAAAALTTGLDLGRWHDAVGTWGGILLALGYGAAILIAFDHPHVARVLSLFAPLGRMALTNYLTQSIVLSAIFYGWGLGLFGRLGEASALAIGVALFVAQTIFSALWLRRYAFGPAEWLWRSFTYGAWQPSRR